MSKRTPSPFETAPAARRTALHVLHACLRGADIQMALDQALARRDNQLDPRDAALATELAYGTLRQKIRLDYILGHFLKSPDRLPTSMRMALAVAAYELLNLDRVPAYATVDWCTAVVKNGVSPRLAAVSNAVLRRVSELGNGADDPTFYALGKASENVRLSRQYACPHWIVELWVKSYGPEKAERLLTASIKAPPLGLRLRPQVGNGAKLLEQWTSESVAAQGTGLALTHAPTGLGAALEEGSVVRQSLAGQEAMQAIGAQDWQRPVWDACCGRGGKTLLLADQNQGQILASDPNAKRLKGLVSSVGRLVVSNVSPFAAKAEASPFGSPLPTVLLDAPCTGLGVLSRRPDIKLRRSHDDVLQLAKVQNRILEHTANVVAPGGVLAYVTCTLAPAENQQQIASFLDQHKDFTLAVEHQTDDDSPLNEFFYAARLERKA